MRDCILIFALVTWSAAAFAEESVDDGEPVIDPPMIRASSVPPGAAVTIDGHDVGRTPALVVVTPGRHEVVLELDDRRTRALVLTVEDEVAEVALEAGSPPSPFEPEDAPDQVRVTSPQARDDERPNAPEPDPAENPDPWRQRVPQEPWLEASAVTGMVLRGFEMPIDSSNDVWSRDFASIGEGPAAIIGFRLGLFPFARNRRPRLRGLGLDLGAAMAVGLDVIETLNYQFVDAGYYEVDILAVYNALLGRPEAGVRITPRLGWSRSVFRLGRENNDIVPTMKYDAIRVGLALQVPLGTRHVLLDIAGDLLGVVSVGTEARWAYGEGDEVAIGGEVSAGLSLRFGKLHVGAHWVGRWISTDYTGTGEGWGEIGMPDTTLEWRGITSTGPAADSHQLFRISLGVRL